MNAAGLALDLGELEEARSALVHMRDATFQRRVERYYTWAEVGLAEVAAAEGDTAAERELLERALAEFRRFDDERSMRYCEELLKAPLSAR